MKKSKKMTKNKKESGSLFAGSKKKTQSLTIKHWVTYPSWFWESCSKREQLARVSTAKTVSFAAVASLIENELLLKGCRLTKFPRGMPNKA